MTQEDRYVGEKRKKLSMRKFRVKVVFFFRSSFCDYFFLLQIIQSICDNKAKSRMVSPFFLLMILFCLFFFIYRFLMKFIVVMVVMLLAV